MTKRNQGLRNQRSDILPMLDSPTINQTIILNSPRFNINLLNDIKRKQNEETVRKDPQDRSTFADFNKTTLKQTLSGLDTWKLHENLKQFGQTRQQLYRHGSELETCNPYITQRVKKSQSSYYSENVIKRRETNKITKNSPYAPDKYTINTRTHNQTNDINHRQIRTIDVRRRKYFKDEEQQSFTPQYPVQRRVFRANKYTHVNTTAPARKDLDIRREETHSSQEMSKNPNRSISDIDKSIQNVVEKYFDQGPITSKSRHDIQSYMSVAKQPIIKQRKTEFVSEIRHEAGTLNFDFYFDEEFQHKRKKLPTPSRKFKIYRNVRSRLREPLEDEHQY